MIFKLQKFYLLLRNKNCSYLLNKLSGHASVSMNSTNVLIYSESSTAANNIEQCLKNELDCNRYTIYNVSEETLYNGAWRGRAALVVVIGKIKRCTSILLQHLLTGGRILSLRSDLLCTVLPYYKVQFKDEIALVTYGECKSKFMHQIVQIENPASIDQYLGHQGHELKIQFLASEETLKNPSVLKVTDITNKGVAIFSLIDIENEGSKYFKEGECETKHVRLEIFREILREFDLYLKEVSGNSENSSTVEYTKGYLLGNYENNLIKDLCHEKEHTKKIDNLTIQFYNKEDSPLEQPSKSFLPVYLNQTPENFSAHMYFANLTSKQLGRILIYSDVMTTTMDIIKDSIAHGIAVVARRQLVGQGRGGNTWITPIGQAAISLQIWQKMSPTLSLIQHASALAAVLAIRSQPYEHLDVKIKWPNDIYYGREVKIGGVVTTANCLGDDVFINIGTGVNISNKVPTTCVNDIILNYNMKHSTLLPPMSTEYFLARYCSELERILDILEEENGVDTFLMLYYKYWLHSEEKIRVQTKDYKMVEGKISGVDSAGWLIVRTANGEVTVTPDGNTFDMMSGLIAPK